MYLSPSPAGGFVIEMSTYNSIKQMALYQFRSMFRNKTAVFFCLVMPLLFVAVFGLMYRDTGVSRSDIGWIDHDGGVAASTLRAVVAHTDQYILVADSEGALRQKLAKGQLKAVVILPQGLSDGLMGKAGPGTVTILFDASSQASSQAVAGLQQLAGVADMAMRGTTPSLVVKAQELPEAASVNVFDFLLPGQLVSMLLSAGLTTVAMSLSNQRQTGTLRHMFSTPLSVGVWMAARVSANLLMAALQTAVLYGVAGAMFNVHMPANIGATLVVLVLCALVTVGMGLVVGVLIPGPDAAMPVAMILFMGSLFLGGSMMPLETGPAILQQIAHFVPTYYMTHALRLVMMQGKSLGEVGPDIAILTGCAAAGLSLAAWRMRRQFITA
jgi:ABC-2 type transport system permease protein